MKTKTKEKAPMETQSAQPGGEGLFSISSLAELFETDRATVRKYLKGVAPAVSLPKLKQYRLTDKNEDGKTVKELLEQVEDPKLAEAKTRSAIADAELRELKVLERKKDLVNYAEVRSELQRVIHHLYQRLAVQQPRDLGPKLRKCKTAGEITAKLRAATAKEFNDLRDNYKRIFGSA